MHDDVIGPRPFGISQADFGQGVATLFGGVTTLINSYVLGVVTNSDKLRPQKLMVIIIFYYLFLLGPRFAPILFV